MSCDSAGLILVEDEHCIVVEPEPDVLVVAFGDQGPPGPPGKSGSGSAMISADPDNQLIEGSDEGLYVPEPTGADYLALYYLARG